MNVQTLKRIFVQIRDALIANKQLLTELDSIAGDGDLGISMEQGFEAVCRYMLECDEQDIGKLLVKSGMVLNGAAPSTMGTILSVGMMSGGKKLAGVQDMHMSEALLFFDSALEGIMNRAHSKRGDKTILDALIPAYEAMRDAAKDGDTVASLQAAADAAHAGMISTIPMKAVHGRAAYYAEESANHQDGGATVGSIILAAVAKAVKECAVESA